MTKHTEEIAILISKNCDFNTENIVKLIEIPPDSTLGDYAFPCFSLAKQFKKNPAQIATELKEKIEKDIIKNKKLKIIKKIEVKGAYLNFFLNKTIFIEQVLKQKNDFKGNKKIILIESPGPNTNKPLHLGHVRNGLLGLSLRNILQKTGNKVINVDIINDRGIHIAKSVLAYKKWGNNKEPNKKPDHFVGDYYVMFNKMLSNNPELETEAQDLLKKWEQNDTETIKLWKKMNGWCIKGMFETYKKLGLIIDKTYYESEHYDKGKSIILEGVKKGLFVKDEKGAIIINLEKYGLDKKVLLRADGTSVYITQDIALAGKRYEDFRMDEMIYVVGNEQNYHFKVLFIVLDKLGYRFAKNCYHLSYGMVNLPEGKMKSREGTIVDADDFMDEIIELSKKEIIIRHENLKESEISKRAEKIALSAIKFYMLKFDPLIDFVYNPKESLSFEGETGPYIQYTHARLNSIIKKFGKKIPTKIDYSCLQEKEEHELITIISQFKSEIETAASQYKPSLVARYLIRLCQLTNNYYHKYQILKEEKNKRDARLKLIVKIKEIISEGLSLLGIEAINEM